jgi:hypothetical protein
MRARALAAAATLLAASLAHAGELVSSEDYDALKAEVTAARKRLDDERATLDALEAKLQAMAPAASGAASPTGTSAPANGAATASAATASAATASAATGSAATGDASLEAQFAAALAGAPPAAPEVAAPPGTPAGGGGGGGGGVQLRLLDLSLDGLFAGGGSTASNDDLKLLDAGGHDPHQRGFTVQNVELSMLGAVDPYLKGEAHVVFQLDDNGETGVELEEAFITTQSLPAGLQLKAGQFFTDFGRLNATHPHTWSFVNAPVISTRVLGEDGLRGPGARLSWLTPAPWYSELFLGVQQSNGETLPSFLGREGQDPIGGHPWKGGSIGSARDALWTLRWLNSVALTKEATLNLGASWATGPNASGPGERTDVVGLDAFYKWTSAKAEKGFPFVAWQSEWMSRRYQAAAFTDDLGAAFPGETLRDSGWYSQVTWGFKPGWTFGGRIDRASGSPSIALLRSDDPLRDERTRLSAALTWYPTEFSKLRFQYDHDVAQAVDDADSLWIQWEFTMGAHGAHKF